MEVRESTPRTIHVLPLICVGVVFILAFAVLVWRLWYVQIYDNPSYSRAQESQSYRRMQTSGIRGRILDRNGIILAESMASYNVVLTCEDFKRPGKWENTIDAVDLAIDGLAHRLNLPREVSSRQVRQHILQNLPMPFIVFRDVGFNVMSQIEEWRDELPGVDILILPKRAYPHGSLAAHVIGSVGYSTAPKATGEKWHFRLPELHGRSGIEARYDDLLSGVGAEAILRVDSRGYAHERQVTQVEKAGQDVRLTIDARLQLAAEAALGKRPGALVALDPRNGDVLALVSTPAYDLNLMIPPVRSETYKELLDNPEHPLFNRAIQGCYPPGSVFKPFTAIAAQENGFDPTTLYNCTGVYTDYGTRLRCTARWGHGELDLREALCHSCNPYFCNLGTTIGMDAIVATAEQAGFGRTTGIDLGGEAHALMPTPEWKQKTYKKPWYASDTAQCAIGQGTVTATPLQVAHAIAAIAVEGKLYRPRLVAMGNLEGELQRTLPWSRDAIRAVIDGMELVVERGTGKTMQVEGVSVAGKTGTAEYIQAKTRERRKRVWCAAFAPSEKPEIVIAAMFEDGVGGGKDVGPVVQKVLSAYFNAKAVSVSTADLLDD